MHLQLKGRSIPLLAAVLVVVLAGCASSGRSVAAPGFMKPEGVVVFHTAGNLGFKKTLEKDEVPKGQVR